MIRVQVRTHPTKRNMKESKMKPTVLGLSASPQKGGKVERVVSEVMTATRLPYELVRLHDLRVGPCKACNGCRKDNLCVVDDDWKALSQKILQTEAHT